MTEKLIHENRLDIKPGIVIGPRVRRDVEDTQEHILGVLYAVVDKIEVAGKMLETPHPE